MKNTLLVIGFLLLCGLIIASVFEYSVPPSARYLVVMMLSFAAGAGGRILGQNIETRFDVKRNKNIFFSVRSAGSAALFVFTAASGYFFYIKPAEAIRDTYWIRQQTIGQEVEFRINDVEKALSELHSSLDAFRTSKYSSLNHLEEARKNLKTIYEPVYYRARIRLAGSLYAGPASESYSGAPLGNREFSSVDIGTLVGLYWSAGDVRHQTDGGGMLGSTAAILKSLEIPTTGMVSDGGGRFSQRIRKDGFRFEDESKEIEDRVNRIYSSSISVHASASKYLGQLKNHPDVYPILHPEK